MKTTSEAKALLVRVLAESDAVWLPIRQSEWEHSRPAAIYFAREAFRANRGVIVAAPGSDAERKAAERAITALVQAGYLKARHRARGRYLRLTDEAEDRLRQLCGLPGLWLAYEAVRRHVGPTWTPEIALNGGRGWGDGHGRELVFVELLLLPALIRGIVVAGSDVYGRVYYRRIADAPSWSEPVEDIEPDFALAALYHEETKAARQRILATDVGSLELGELPLPCAMGDITWATN
jgi:DNA-binding transcriptional ArsR family regulator